VGSRTTHPLKIVSPPYSTTTTKKKFSAPTGDRAVAGTPPPPQIRHILTHWHFIGSHLLLSEIQSAPHTSVTINNLLIVDSTRFNSNNYYNDSIFWKKCWHFCICKLEDMTRAFKTLPCFVQVYALTWLYNNCAIFVCYR
jgi:hypothetical protein